MDYPQLLDAVQRGGQWSPRAGYEGGKNKTAMRLWRPRNRSADAEIRADYELLTARARWLSRNNPLCVGAKDTIVNNVIGEGVQTKAAVRNAKGELLTDWNRQANDKYRQWMDEADAGGRQHWFEMTRTNLHQCIETGDGLLVETAIADPGRLLPIAFEAIEPDQIDTTRDRPSGENQNEIRRGLEIDRRGRVVAYHLFTQHPRGLHSTWRESERVDASRVIHLYRAKRSGQTRGVTWFAPIIQALWDLYEYQGHEINAAKVASYFVYMLKQKNPQSDGLGLVDEDSESSPSDDDGNPQAPLGPGIGMYGNPEDSLEVIQSNRPNSQAEAWIKMLMQVMGVGVGLSFQRFTGDYSETNFSSARAADLQDRKGFVPTQNWHAWYVDCEVRRRVTLALIGTQQLEIPAGGLARFNRNQSRWLACRARPPGWGYVDPQKQVQAAADAIAAGLSTWERELAAIGLDRDETFETLKEEQDKLAELGLNLSLATSARPPTEPAVADRDEGDDE